jgi:hypothetical protein
VIKRAPVIGNCQFKAMAPATAANIASPTSAENISSI